MTRTDESPGGLVNRPRISSADTRFPKANKAFIISRSRRVSGSVFVFAVVIASPFKCDTCHILPATFVACQEPSWNFRVTAHR